MRAKPATGYRPRLHSVQNLREVSENPLSRRLRANTPLRPIRNPLRIRGQSPEFRNSRMFRLSTNLSCLWRPTPHPETVKRAGKTGGHLLPQFAEAPQV